MKLSSSLLRLLNIRSDEQPVVLNLMAFQFFQGAGIAFFFTATFAMFLERFSVNELPLVFILAAVLLFVTGFGYSWLEHRMKITKLGMIISALMVISILVFRIACYTITAPWLLTLMLAWFYVLYLLNNLEFWGIASIMFDVRQSKRLFGLISSGDIPAKFIGYSIASLIVTTVGTANLLYVGILFILGSFPFLIRISKAGITTLESHGPAMHKNTHHSGPVQMILSHFTSNKLIERTAKLAFLFSLCLFLINFIFYAEVKTAYHEDQEMARFIALFLAGSRMFAIIVKVIFTGRMMAKLGFMRSLLITPVVLAAFALLIAITGSLNPDSHMIFYIFGMMAITADILNSAIHLPGFLTLMQPLSTHDRLKAHNIVKGLMDPFAYLLTGVFLLLMLNFLGHINLLTLNYILLGLLVFWVVGIFKVNSQYLKTLVQSITTRTFNDENPNIVDKESIRLISGKLENGTPLEKIYILKLLANNPDVPDLRRLILLALSDDSPTVKQEAIALLLQLDAAEARMLLREILSKEENPQVLEIALDVLCKLEFDEKLVMALTQHTHEVVRHCAISMLLTQHGTRRQKETEEMLMHLAVSTAASDRRAAALIICKLGRPVYAQLIVMLLEDADTVVSQEAIIAAGRTADDAILKALLRKFPAKPDHISEALFEAGEQAIPHIFDFIKSGHTGDDHLERLIRLCGRIGGKSATDMLCRLTEVLPAKTSAIVEALRKCKFQANAQQLVLMEKLITKYLAAAARINEFLRITDHTQSHYALLNRALQIEKDAARESLLDLLSFLYNPAEIAKIKRGIKSGKRESIANALELIEMTVPHKIAQPFLDIFEHAANRSNTEHASDQLLSHTYWELLCKAILQPGNSTFNDWTQACCLHTLAAEKRSEYHRFATGYLSSEIIMLRETAYALTLV